jgi:aquaporin Z
MLGLALQDHMKRYGAEFSRGFWRVLVGCAKAVFAAAFPPLGIGFLGVSLALGLSVLRMALGIAHISGCHLNPASSIGLWAVARFFWSRPVALVYRLMGSKEN